MTFDDQLAAFLAGSPHNLVSRGERYRVGVHVAEARALAEVLPVDSGSRWLDLGTGGGLPGLVCAHAHPASHWYLLDATAKKLAAVQDFVGEVGLANVTLLPGRAEVLARRADLRGQLDGVVARAVGPLVVVAELARGFVRDGGTLVVVKGPNWQTEEASFLRARGALRLSRPQAAVLTSAERPTVVVTMRAEGSPPQKTPRGDGLPRAQPLGDA